MGLDDETRKPAIRFSYAAIHPPARRLPGGEACAHVPPRPHLRGPEVCLPASAYVPLAPKDDGQPLGKAGLSRRAPSPRV